jgi:hypothetical protein
MGADPGEQWHQHVIGGCGRGAETHRSGNRVVGELRGCDRLVDEPQQHPRVAVHHAAGLGQLDAAAVPLDQLDPDPALQRSQARRHRGLCDDELLGRATDRTMVGNGDEHLQLMNGQHINTPLWIVKRKVNRRDGSPPE